MYLNKQFVVRLLKSLDLVNHLVLDLDNRVEYRHTVNILIRERDVINVMQNYRFRINACEKSEKSRYKTNCDSTLYCRRWEKIYFSYGLRSCAILQIWNIFSPNNVKSPAQNRNQFILLWKIIFISLRCRHSIPLFDG